MRCEIVKDMLEKFIEGELEEPLKKEIEKHIAECNSCKNELLLARKVPFMVRSMQSHKLPDDIIHGVLERINKPSKQFFFYKHFFGMSLYKKILFATVIPVVFIILILGIVRLKPDEELINEPESLFIERTDNSIKIKSPILPIETSKTRVISKDVSHLQKRTNRIVSINKVNKKSEINNDEALLAVDQINFALEILGMSAKKVQSSTLEESERALSITMDKSQDIIKTLSEVQTEIVNNLKQNLNFINQFQNREESTQ